MNDNIAAILDGPDYFFCAAFKCRLAKAVCAKRQAFGVAVGYNRLRVPEPCLDCPQGQRVIAGTESAGPESAAPASSGLQPELIVNGLDNLVKSAKLEQEEDVMTTQKDEKGKILKICHACNELKPHHGRGLCMSCYQQKKKDGTLPPALRPQRPRGPRSANHCCTNCERNQKYYLVNGLCSGCRAAAGKSIGAVREAALAAAKIRFNAPTYDGKRRGKRIKHDGPVSVSPLPRREGQGEGASDLRKEKEERILTEIFGDRETPGEIIPGKNCIALEFAPDDAPLYDAILAEAKRHRRDPDQQVLWIVQEALSCGGLE